LFAIGASIGEAMIERQQHTFLAMTVQTWHVHVLLAATSHGVGDVVKCMKDAARYHLRLGRPIWTAGYDKRFCFTEAAIQTRRTYIEAHNTRMGWPATPWDFIRAT